MITPLDSCTTPCGLAPAATAGYSGWDSFTYYVSDGHVATPVAGTVSVAVTTTTSTSTTGTSGSDSYDFSLRVGPQLVNGQAGNDTISGGVVNDNLNGAAGNDVLYGGTGSDSFIWMLADVTGSPPGTQDVIYDFEGAGDGRLSGDTLNFLGFSAGSTLTLKAQSTVSSHLYYYTLTDAASGAHEVIAINSLNGAALTVGDFLFH